MKPISALAACALAALALAGCGGSTGPSWSAELELACHNLATDLQLESQLPSAVGAGQDRSSQYIAHFQARRQALREFSDRVHRISAHDDEEILPAVLMADELSETLDLATEHARRGGVVQAIDHLGAVEAEVDRTVQGMGVDACVVPG